MLCAPDYGINMHLFTRASLAVLLSKIEAVVWSVER